MTDDRRDLATAKFLRGLTIGALLGAVIAGSSLWGRWWTTRGRAAPTPDPVDEPQAVASESETPTP